MRNVIIDCDPGHDDAVALLLAVGDPTINLVGVTTVAGNHHLDVITRNARAVLELAGAAAVPVHAGADRPLLRPGATAVEVHGATGLNGVTLPAPAVPVAPGHAVQFIIDTIMREPSGTVTLVAIGPLTNLALAARLEPRIIDRAQEVVLMGGSTIGGNASPAAEFNIFVDPEAADIVFGGRWTVTAIGLDVTQRAIASTEIINRIREIDTEPARVVADLLAASNAQHAISRGTPFAPIHDPCAVARIIRPELIQVITAPVRIELAGTEATGATIVDRRPRNNAEVTTKWATEIDAPALWDLVVASLQRIGDPRAWDPRVAARS